MIPILCKDAEKAMRKAIEMLTNPGEWSMEFATCAGGVEVAVGPHWADDLEDPCAIRQANIYEERVFDAFEEARDLARKAHNALLAGRLQTALQFAEQAMDVEFSTGDAVWMRTPVQEITTAIEEGEDILEELLEASSDNMVQAEDMQYIIRERMERWDLPELEQATTLQSIIERLGLSELYREEVLA